MSDLNVSERRIRPIQEAITAGNWKQALQLCDKWQKKGEKSDRFLALRASILVNQPDKQQFEKGRSETLNLCKRPTPVTDIEALYQLQDILKRLSLYDEEGPKLWDRAISALPNDKDLLKSLLNGSISDGSWLTAQKAAMALRKAAPTERQYEFINILLCYLIHRDESLAQKDRALFGTLAYRLILKAAESVPTNKDQMLAPGKAISTPEELALLVTICISTGNTDEALKLLESGSLGLYSKVAEQDPGLVFTLLLEALDASTQHAVVLEVCQRLLAGDTSGAKAFAEDDRIWRIILRLAKNKQLREPCSELVESAVSRQPDCRAALLAKLDLLVTAVTDDGSANNELAKTCNEYFSMFKSKPFCYDDLAQAFKALGADHIRGFIHKINTHDATEMEKVVCLKLDYSTLSETNSSEADFLNFATKAIKLHKQISKTKTECPEAAVLAAQALLRLAAKSGKISFAVQAGFVLQNTLATFVEYYPSAVRLVQLCRVLGQISLAMESFGSLSVKNMQWETVGHLLLTRMSSLHPIQSSIGNEWTNPLDAFDSGLYLIESMKKSLQKQMQAGLEFGSYSNIMDSVKVRHDIEHSLNHYIYAIEERKNQFLTGALPLRILENHPQSLVDLRDFSFLSSTGTLSSALEGYLQCGPLPHKRWTDAMTVADHVRTYLGFELSGHFTQANQAFDAAKAALTNVAVADASEMADQLTEAEMSSLECCQAIGAVAGLLRDPTALKQSDLDDLVAEIITCLDRIEPSGTAIINGITIPTWKYMHTCFTGLETIQTSALLLSLLSRKTKVAKGKGIVASKEKLGDLQRSVSKAESAIRQRTRELRDGINVAGVLGRFIDAAAGRLEDEQMACDEYQTLSDEFAGLYEEVALEEYCGRMKDSWEDALDGILAFKLKAPK